jgi:hypothetical protein
MASYTYSEAKGLNTRPLVDPRGGQGSAFWASRAESDPNVWLNAEGLLAGDRTHALRVSSNVDLGKRFRLGGVLNIQSGRPGKAFALSDWGDFHIDLQMLNVTNEDATTYYQSNILAPGSSYLPVEWVYPRRLTVRLKLAF